MLAPGKCWHQRNADTRAFLAPELFLVAGFCSHQKTRPRERRTASCLDSVMSVTLLPDGRRVKSVAFSPDGKLVASGSFDGTVQLWDVATGAPRGEPPKGHSGWVSSVAFSPDGKLVVSGLDNVTVQL
jgi:WD40 repeat protein